MTQRAHHTMELLLAAAILASLAFLMTGCNEGGMIRRFQVGRITHSRLMTRLEADIDAEAVPNNGPAEELWVIAKPERLADDRAGCSVSPGRRYRNPRHRHARHDAAR
jgi:hypothetical protein